MVLLTRIDARNPGTLTGAGNNTYLIDGPEPALVDAGVGHPDHVEEVARLLDGRALSRVLLTHGHPDHASGVPALLAHWPRARVCRWFSEVSGGEHELRDGDRLPAGDGWLTTVHTPGHAPDHVCFIDLETRDLFCGDMMTATTSIMVPPAARGGSVRDYLHSLTRLSDLAPAIAWPGHGDTIDDPGRRIEQYVAHRLERERQVLDCLAEGITDLDAIVARVYAETPRDLWLAARLTIEAHLEKIAEDRGN